MKKVCTALLITTCICMHSFARQAALLFTAENNSNTQVLTINKHNYCIAGNAVYLVEKKKLIQKLAGEYHFNEATVYNGNIALATNNGIQVFDTKTNTLTALLPAAIKGTINHIKTDNNHHIWFTKEYEGCFMINDNTVLQKVKVPVTYALNFTGNGNMWVGTNVGLYKVPTSGNAIERYAEEGIASNDLPDNLVERLFTDAQSNVWVIMPGHISYIAAGSEEELPDYEHVGNKDNELFDITNVSVSKQAYLFATAQGILLMHNIQRGEALYTGEIHQTINEKAYLLTDVVIEKPEALKNEVVKRIQTCGSETYFITRKGLWSVNTTKFTHRLSSQFKI